MLARVLLPVVVLLGVAACQPGGVPPVPAFVPFPSPGARPLEVSRVGGDGLGAYLVSPRSGPATLATSGVAAKVTGDAKAGWRIEPEATGEMRLSVDENGKKTESVLLVFALVGEAWGAPMAQPGPMVNTAAWEDGLSLSPDANTLFVHYVPITISGFFVGDSKHPWAERTRGPYGAPERPDFPAKRISAEGRITPGFALYEAKDVGRPWPPTALFAFRRQKDGSFGEPHLIGPQDDGDGSLGAFGPCIPTGPEGKGRFVLAFNDPATMGAEDTESDIYAFAFDPAKPTTFGRFHRAGGQIRSEGWTGVRIGPDPKGHQGNPHLHTSKGGRLSLFVDNEAIAEKDLFVAEGQGPVTSATWYAGWEPLPSPISEPNVEEVQPFFDGKRLVARKDNTISAWDHLGGPFASASSWGPRQKWLVPGSDTKAGSLFVVGEPTVGRDARGEILSFVYGIMREDGSIDLNAGYVRRRT
ncbi:MAG: hypothetical protein KIS66_09720 [Fimbriimonadaceae bacterium]|nr:hypothetical protein [Fimbriimonadaceae bacterium]